MHKLTDKMKISIIGAGNVGGLTAMRLAESGAGEIVLVDAAKGVAVGKAFDLEDSRAVLKTDFNVRGSGDINEIKDSDIVVVTAGLARKPGMTREDLLNKNAQIVTDVSLSIKNNAPRTIVIIVTNPLDLMTRLALKVTGFSPNRVLGMGVTLDAARFANLIGKELNLSPADVQARVIGCHGEGMLALARFTKIKGVELEKFIDKPAIDTLVLRTFERGKEIVSLLGSGSAYFAPSAAITEIVKAIVKDEKRVLGACVYLNGEYGIKDVCLGLPCRIGKGGVEQIIELDLNEQEKEALKNCALKLKEQFKAVKEI